MNNNLITLFDYYYDIFKNILNNIQVIDLISLNLVCKKFNKKIILLIYDIINEGLYNCDHDYDYSILKTYEIYKLEKDIFNLVLKNEIEFLNNIIIKYYNIFKDIYNLIMLNQHEENKEYDKIYDLFYSKYLDLLFPNINETLINYIEIWDFINIDPREFIIIINDFLLKKIKYIITL